MTTTTSAKHLYREAMEQVNSFNSKLLLDRKLRMPYIDNQTGIAQQDCRLWVSRVQRCTPLKDGQVYSYPARRWLVKKRPVFIGTRKLTVQRENEDFQESSQDSQVFDETKSTYDSNNSQQGLNIYEEFYDEETFDSEFDSDEEFGPRKGKRRRGGGKGKPREQTMKFSGRKNEVALKLAGTIRTLSREEIGMMTEEDRKKPYDCQLCGKRYKNQQGLRYHYEHHNHELEDPSPAMQQIVPQQIPLPPPVPIQVQPPPVQPVDDVPALDHVTGAKRRKGMPPSSYCDFCLGSAEENKKSGVSEELISCADCGRSGHPSCLQFNNNLSTQVKKYKWQCIECKCCCLCGTSDNDEQLLFCDDCDRGYHMYCLTPPIAEPPEGSWQCQLCEARVKGRDISKVAVLSEHMDTVS